MQYLTEYQTFKSKHELNEAIAEHLSAHAFELSGTVRKVLTIISRYAVKFPGAAHLKAVTIAESIGMSEKTIRRAINRLQALRIVRKVVTKRKVTGGQGANIVQVLPYDNASDQADVSRREEGVEPTVASAQPSENKSEPYSSLKQNTVINNTYGKHIDTSSEISPSANALSNSPDSTSPYVRFKSLIADKKVRNKIYGIWLAHTRYIRNSYGLDLLLNIGISAVLVTFKARGIRNPSGYYNGVLDRMLDRLHYDTMPAIAVG